MSYGFNNEVYQMMRRMQTYDVITADKVWYEQGIIVGSVVAANLLVEEDTSDLFGQTHIDYMIALGNIKLIV